ncbi:DUF2510 domain-containing protein, partial [Schumannella luteola]
MGLSRRAPASLNCLSVAEGRLQLEGEELVSLSAAAPVAAWYPDPTDTDSLRWWDGL